MIEISMKALKIFIFCFIHEKIAYSNFDNACHFVSQSALHSRLKLGYFAEAKIIHDDMLTPATPDQQHCYFYAGMLFHLQAKQNIQQGEDRFFCTPNAKIFYQCNILLQFSASHCNLPYTSIRYLVVLIVRR